LAIYIDNDSSRLLNRGQTLHWVPDGFSQQHEVNDLLTARDTLLERKIYSGKEETVSD